MTAKASHSAQASISSRYRASGAETTQGLGQVSSAAVLMPAQRLGIGAVAGNLHRWRPQQPLLHGVEQQREGDQGWEGVAMVGTHEVDIEMLEIAKPRRLKGDDDGHDLAQR